MIKKNKKSFIQECKDNNYYFFGPTMEELKNLTGIEGMPNLNAGIKQLKENLGIEKNKGEK